jgi:hypothetical protein
MVTEIINNISLEISNREESIEAINFKDKAL